MLKKELTVEKSENYNKVKEKVDELWNDIKDLNDGDAVIDKMAEEFVYTDEIQEIIGDHDLENSDAEKQVDKLKALYFVAKLDDAFGFEDTLGFKSKISASPYSFSTYLLDKNDKIDWGYKPLGSIRVSDHWNFTSRGSVHCSINGVEEHNIQKVMVGVYNGESYDIVWEEGE